MKDATTEEKARYAALIGRMGEEAACKYLKKQKYKVSARNYRHGRCEIDIVAKKDGVIVFFEIKARSFSSDEAEPSDLYRPADAVTFDKRKNIIKAAMNYLKEDKSEERARFDVLEIYFEKRPRNKLKLHRINHIESAFDSRGHIIH